MNYAIKLTPKSKSFKPHVWREGGLFATEKKAEFQAKQTRKMKDIYEKVEVIPFPFPKQYSSYGTANRAKKNWESLYGEQDFFSIEQLDADCFELIFSFINK